MSIVFPKNKEKRTRTTSNENNTSFVKNVTSRVSGLLPSTITKWFSSPTSSNANGSTATAEATDSSTEDEATESPVITQPPSKRMRFSNPNKFNHFGPTDPNCSTSNIDITDVPVSSFPGTQFKSRNRLTLTPIRTTNETTNMSVKTKSERDTSRYKLQHTVSSIGQSVAMKRKSIFDKSSEDTSPANVKSSSSAEKKPCFKRSMLGSPFYPGRTMYGGASSSYINQPNIQQHTVALVNETKSSEDSVMSSSARRIMDLLEAYSSPLRDARRIPQTPQYTRLKSDSVNTTTDRFEPYGNKSLSYKTQELHVPSIASILRLKQRSRLMDTTKTARQIIASHSSASSYPMTYPSPTSASTEQSQPIETRQETQKEPDNKMTTKVKTRVARTNRGHVDNFDIVTPVKLPSATLQIDQNKLPKFSFDTPPVSKLPTTSTPKIVPLPKTIEIKKKAQVSTSKPETLTTSNVFKFSNPVRISSDTPDVITAPPKFTFDSPERRIDQQFDSKSDVSSVVGNKETDKSTTIPKGWQCPDCWVNNKAEVIICVCCGYKYAKPAKCSVCKIADSEGQKDKCVLCNKMASPPSAKVSQPSKWKCDSCWVMNEDAVEKCVCCSSDKPTEASKAAAAARAAEFAAIPKVKLPICGGCFIGGTKWTEPVGPTNTFQPPAGTTNFFRSSIKGDSGFITLVKTLKSDKWECASCLVRNESDKSACVCCGSEKEPKSKLPDTKFNFGTDSGTSFKFGIDPNVQKAKLTKTPEVTSTPEPVLKEKSEANNNVLAETPTYTFSLPTKKIESKTDTLKTKPEGAVKFSFGIPKDASVVAKKPESTKVVDEDTEKPQEVPQINFTSSTQETIKPAGELFTYPLPQQPEKPKTITIASNLFARPSIDEKKDTPNNVINVQPVSTSIGKSQPQSTFTLGMKPATNLFASPSSNPFTPSAQTTAVTTSVSSVPLILPVTPVQKTDTTSSATTTPAPPMFSFGNNNVNNPIGTAAPTIALASADKSKLQFTFGSGNATKSDPPPSLLTASNSQSLFKSPFASPSDNTVKSTNTFGLSPGNALGTNSALVTNTNGLSATNGLSGSGLTTNSLGGNHLSGNPLGGNTMTGNTLSGNLLGGNSMTGNTFGTNSLTSGNGVTSTSTLGGTNGLPGNAGGIGLQSNNTSSTLMNNPLTSGTSNIFGNAVQKENMWNASSTAPSTNMFVSNATTNNLQKPPTFPFGTSTPFNATSAPPAFGSNAQPPQNIFGMANQNNNSQPTLFSNPAQNQSPAPLFGSPQQASHPTPQLGMFGAASMGAAPTFGAPAPSIPSFEAPSMPAPAPSFNFGATGQPAVFGFGQQQQQQPPQQAGVYSFGGPPPAGPQVQFNMGTAPNPAVRRLRKAVRRTTPR